MIGETLAHYEIVGSLGKGGMGEVYVAEDTKLQRRVALNPPTPRGHSLPFVCACCRSRS